MAILITGATGLIGKQVARRFLHKGSDVRYLSTSRTKLDALPGAKGFYWNPESGEVDTSAFLGVQTVIHLAGATIAQRWTAEARKEILESRTQSAQLIFKVLSGMAHQVSHIVSASGTAIYPEGRRYAEQDKQEASGFLADVVRQWEASVGQFSSIGIKTCILRTGIVLSQDGGALVPMVKAAKLGAGSAVGSGKQVWSWIHEDDLADMYVYAVEKQLEGIFNAVSPSPVTNEQFVKTLAQALDRTVFLPAVPTFVLKMVLGDMHQLLTSGQNVAADKIMASGFQFRHPELQEALNDVLHKKSPT